MISSVTGVTDVLQGITQALDDLDRAKLLHVIHDTADTSVVNTVLKTSDVYHRLVNALWHRWGPASSAVPIVYLLCLQGASINHQDENGDTALLAYLRDEDNISDDVLVAFLRCGADVTLKNKNGQDVLSLVLQSDDLPKPIRARVLEYVPGIWRAVDSDDAMTVRRLVNQWCTIRVMKDELSVLQVAFNRGTENIIRVISGVGPSMDLAHAVLAGDRKMVKTILESKGRYNINLKNMAEGGSSPLFYALCQNDKEMVKLLMKHGARLNLPMEGENGMDIPLYLAALSHKPKIDTDLLRDIIPEDAIDQLYYQGKNVIFYCVDHDLELQLFEAILRKCSALVLTQRLEDNLDVREYAEKLDKMEYVSIIDKVVVDWCCDKERLAQRQLLALHGFHLTAVLATQTPLPVDTLDFVNMVPKYEECKARLCDAVGQEDLLTVKEILYNEIWLEQSLGACLADSRLVGDGQPLLHKAVLRHHVDIVREIALCLFHRCKRKLDTIRDQYYRTALHYVYGMEDGKEMINILEDLGMSEYVMDKDGRSPQAFKDRRGQKEMKSLMQYHLTQDFSKPEPDPWSVKLPLPIVGYMTKCVHDHHERKKTPSITAGQYDRPEMRDEPNNTPTTRPLPTLTDSQLKYTIGSTSNTYTITAQNVSNSMHRSISSDNNGLIHTYRSDNAGSRVRSEELIKTELGDRYAETGTGTGQYGADTDRSEFQLQPKISRSKSDEALESQSHSLREEQSARNLPKGDNSDTDSEVRELEEDYDGDYSDIETDDEASTPEQANYCAIL